MLILSIRLNDRLTSQLLANASLPEIYREVRDLESRGVKFTFKIISIRKFITDESRSLN